MRLFPILCAVAAIPACGRLAEVGKAPDFTSLDGTNENHAIYSYPLPSKADPNAASDAASLWTGERKSLLGDNRAARRGDILTVVIQIDDKAEISNSTGRTRTGSEKMAIPSLLGIPQRLAPQLPTGASLADAVSTSSNSAYQGDGSVNRKEKLTLRVAATIIEELPNGVLRLQGSQQVRVNYELRDLTVEGYVRPADISRQNEVSYDKIAGARISYGGRGQISDFQQPRYGQQIADIVLPF